LLGFKLGLDERKGWTIRWRRSVRCCALFTPRTFSCRRRWGGRLSDGGREGDADRCFPPWRAMCVAPSSWITNFTGRHVRIPR